jgi:hypothetical protein
VTRAQAAAEELAAMWAAIRKKAADCGVLAELEDALARMRKPVCLDAQAKLDIHAVHQRGNLRAIGASSVEKAMFYVRDILYYTSLGEPTLPVAKVLTWTRNTSHLEKYLHLKDGKPSPTGFVEMLWHTHVKSGMPKSTDKLGLTLDSLAMMKSDAEAEDGAAKAGSYVEPPKDHRKKAAREFVDNVRPPRACCLQPTGPFTRRPVVRRLCRCCLARASPLSLFKVALRPTCGRRASRP